MAESPQCPWALWFSFYHWGRQYHHQAQSRLAMGLEFLDQELCGTRNQVTGVHEQRKSVPVPQKSHSTIGTSTIELTDWLPGMLVIWANKKQVCGSARNLRWSKRWHASAQNHDITAMRKSPTTHGQYDKIQRGRELDGTSKSVQKACQPRRQLLPDFNLDRSWLLAPNPSLAMVYMWCPNRNSPFLVVFWQLSHLRTNKIGTNNLERLQHAHQLLHQWQVLSLTVLVSSGYRGSLNGFGVTDFAMCHTPSDFSRYSDLQLDEVDRMSSMSRNCRLSIGE
jgi:hypothetical protein